MLLDGESFAVSAINVNERKRAVNFMHILLGTHSIHEIISRNSGWNANRLNWQYVHDKEEQLKPEGNIL